MCVGEQLDLHERRAEEATKQFQYRGTAASIRYSVARLIPSSRAASSTSFADSAEVRWQINARMASSRRSATSHSRSFRAPLSFISYQVRIFRERWETAFSRFVQICCPALMNSYTFSILGSCNPLKRRKIRLMVSYNATTGCGKPKCEQSRTLGGKSAAWSKPSILPNAGTTSATLGTLPPNRERL
jgi:hypothetical protein